MINRGELAKNNEFIAIKATTWYLERALSHSSHKSNEADELVVERKFFSSAESYLSLYTSVGKKWGWARRHTLSSSDLLDVIKSSSLHTLEAHYKHERVGFVELAFEKKSCEIVYFGLLPDYIGKGLGRKLMRATLEYVASRNVDRVWLHTCEYDHPGALDFYQKCGFQVISKQQDDALYAREFLNRRSSLFKDSLRIL